jgi:hypothetical protein
MGHTREPKMGVGRHTRKDVVRRHTKGCRSPPHERMSFAATRKDVGSYPFRRGLTSQGSMNPGRAPRWSSAHCPRGVPAMKMTPLQASNLKQEDNLRPKKMGNTVNDTTEKGGLFGFFFFLAADNLVADPLPRVRS